MGSVRVFARIRKCVCEVPCVATKCDKSRPVIKTDGRSFHFDGVFGPTSTQTDVYREVALPIVAYARLGYNGSILMYGQTGSGKTHTMRGDGTPDGAGIAQRCAAALFADIPVDASSWRVRVGAVEVYDDDVFDLLVDDRRPVPLPIRETADAGFVADGQTWIDVRSEAEVLFCLDAAATRRRTAETLMNSSSSRSHEIFSILLEVTERAEVITSRLVLVDLAGSERIKKSGVAGEQKKEAASINSSLLALGNVVRALTSKQRHIPYRDSALTKLLQVSVGGNSRLSFVATCSPCEANVGESRSTVDFATNVSKIKIDVSKNVVSRRQSRIPELLRTIEDLKRENEELRRARSVVREVYLPTMDEEEEEDDKGGEVEMSPDMAIFELLAEMERSTPCRGQPEPGQP